MAKPLHRRTVLRGMAGGVSVAVALPLLEAMLDQHGEALADGTGLPLRFLTWFWGNGIVPDRWTPPNQGPGYTLSQELKPLANVAEYVSVLTGFDSHVAPKTKITHHEGMSIFSGFNNRDIGLGQGFYSNAGGPTIDQLIADVPGVGDRTPIRSVQLGVSKKESTADYGTTLHNLSHRGYLQPLPPEHDPRVAWSRLFDMFVPPDDPQGPLRVRVLDLVRGQIGKLKQRLGRADIERLDAHLDGIAELQKKIESLPPVCQAPTLDDLVDPGEIMAPFTGVDDILDNVERGGTEPIRLVSEAMSDLLVYAFTCGVTHVGSLLFVEGAGEHKFSDITGDANFDEEHHLITHSTNYDAIDSGVVYTMERLAYLLERMRNTPDGASGNLLDNSVVFAASDCSSGWDHSVDNQPMLVCGGGGGALVNPGIHYASPNGQNPTDVLLALLQIFDPAATSVGADDPMSTTPLSVIRT